MRHFNSIIAGFKAAPREIDPAWATTRYRGKEYDDAEGCAYGFVEGMKLCWNDWQPMLARPEGHSWFRPIALLGEDEFSPDQDELTKTPAKRAKLAQQIPEVVAMHAYPSPFGRSSASPATAGSWASSPTAGSSRPPPGACSS